MDKKVLKLYGMEWYIFVFFAAVILAAVYFGIVPNQLIGAIAVMFTLGIILGEIGERIPIWNKYCGGGAILAFLVCGLLTFKGLLPEGVVEISKGWMNDYSFLNLFIAFLVVGSLLGFLLFNVYPAKVFMGDTGSLALGGFVAASAYMMRMPLFIPIIGLIYLVEVLSVIIQVTYFKRTGGKRIFKMAPIHHHFELCGWSETRVVAVFAIVTAILCMVAYLGL